MTVDTREVPIVVRERKFRGDTISVPLTFPADQLLADWSFRGKAREARGDATVLGTFSFDTTGWPVVVASIEIGADWPDRAGADIVVTFEGGEYTIIVWQLEVETRYTEPL